LDLRGAGVGPARSPTIDRRFAPAAGILERSLPSDGPTTQDRLTDVRCQWLAPAPPVGSPLPPRGGGGSRARPPAPPVAQPRRTASPGHHPRRLSRRSWWLLPRESTSIRPTSGRSAASAAPIRVEPATWSTIGTPVVMERRPAVAAEPGESSAPGT